MAAPPHRIRRLRLRLSAPSRAEAFELRASVRERLDEVLLASLEAAFDEIAPGNELVRVPRLELRAEVSSLNELADVLPGLVRSELAAWVSVPPRRASGVLPSGIVAGAGAPPRATPSESHLRHYLETGLLPWPLSAGELQILLAELSSDELARVAVSSAADRRPSEQAVIYFRLLQIVADERWVALARGIIAVPPEPRATAARAVAAVAVLARAGGSERHARLRVAAGALVIARVDPTRGALVSPFSSASGSTDRAAVAAEIERWPGPVREFFRHAGVLPWPEPGLSRRVSEGRSETGATIGPADPASRGPEAPASAPPPWRSDSTTSPSRGASPSSSRSREAPPPTEIDRAHGDAGLPAAVAARGVSDSRRGGRGELPFGLAASHAGLILLHPFLARFFEHTGVKSAGEPGLPADRLPRAAALLHACASTDEEPFEYELALIKILVGLAPEAPLPLASGLVSDADRAEVDGLLRAVIDHWAVLKKTSVDGLRATFLRRDGLVREEERSFRLQVEPAPFDLLLCHLPWGLGVVKLPWGPKPIFTEWIAP